MVDDLELAAGDPEKDRNFITALARGLDILRAFRPGETELTNTDLAERTGLPKPTVSRLTYTLCQLDYLTADRQSGGYRLGAGVLQLGYGVLSGMEMARRAQAVMKDLQSGPNTYTTSALAERHRVRAVYVAVHASEEDISLQLHVGSRLPLFQSAIGRAILVAMPGDEQERILALAAVDDPDGDADRRAHLDTAREEFRTRHYVTGFGEWRRDVNGIAVPVTSLDGRRIWGMNVGGPSFHVTPEELEKVYAPRLIEAARALGPFSPESV
ncbi:MAG: IclR family transcriptional regulator [Rhodobacteraceae bacterium]|nr:IclR family transcriptional regulator [Paracoccaceae bacterium]QEW20509.1 Pca regulon regulatory protein [Marinibacterium anthonyi]